MCEAISGATWAMLAAAAAAGGGAYMSAEAANDAADRQAAALNAAMEQQDNWSRKAETKALENADQYDMTDRTKRFEDTRAAAGESLAQSLIKSRDETGSPSQASGRLSESFTSDRASKLADQFQQSVDMARLMGKMRGTGDMLGNEAITNADYASQLNTIGRNARGSLDAAQPGIISAGKVNSGQVATGSLISSLGTGYLMSGLGSAFSGAGSGSSSVSGLGAGADLGSGMGNTLGSGAGTSAGGIGTGYNLGSGITNSSGSMFGNGTPMFGYGVPY